METKLDALTAISPLDGRYWKQVNALSAYFSEFSLIRYRVLVEIEYFIALCEIPLPQLKDFDHKNFEIMKSWYQSFSQEDAVVIKKKEEETNHDVKAMEYFIKGKMDNAALSQFKEFVHFGLTSQDINNTAIPLALKESMEKVYLPTLNTLVSTLEKMAIDLIDVPMLARTHGQPATPTRVGKEIMVFVERIKDQRKLLENLPYTSKFGGATGQFNAHVVAFPAIDWITFANNLANKLGLQREQWTTQIAHYDNIGALCDNLKRINVILINLCRDFWIYISMEYFKQQINKNEVGSSAMPHKVNPIDFENAEGNLGLANAIFEHLTTKLPISRLQRDLTDSTVLRNLGVPFGHSLVAFKSLSRGLNKLTPNQEKIKQDLEDNFIVVSEAIQTILRRENYPNPYEILKNLTRTGEKITHEEMIKFVNTLNVPENVKAELRMITPLNFIGMVPAKK